MTVWYPKRDLVVETADGLRRHVLAGQPIPADLVELVPAKDRRKAAEDAANSAT